MLQKAIEISDISIEYKGIHDSYNQIVIDNSYS